MKFDITASADHRPRIDAWLAELGADVCDVLAHAGVRYVVLEPGQRFADVSAVLRRIAAGVDGWPIPPAGLFVVEERTVYLRSMSPMTFFHETAHALDLALGGGVYLSGIDPRVRRAFASATAFVTPYAASACDEYFAESARAYWEKNDSHSLWPRATRERLAQCDPRVFAIFEGIFNDEIPRLAAIARARRCAA
jgi:hypothetical protein